MDTVLIIKSIAQILFLTVFFYNFYTSLSQNKATQLIKTAGTYLAIYLFAVAVDLTVLVEILKTAAVPFAVFLFVIYQPELRRAFTPGFTKRIRFFRHSAQVTVERLDDIIEACQRLVQSKRGALIVFPRQVSIKQIIETGTKVDADISSAFILTVFEHDTPLHDGAMIIQGSKIVAAGCYLPLSSKQDIQQSFGTRHRAALGVVEESDAVVLVVSEETGAISLAYNGKLYYGLEPEAVKSSLIALFSNLEDSVNDKTEEVE